MPRLPGAEDLGGRPVPSGRGAPVGLNLSTPRPSQELNAAADMGVAAANLGAAIHNVFENERIKNNEAQVDDAVNQYLNAQLELEYGDNGYTQYRGGAAVNRPLLDEYRKMREETAKRISSNLKNPEQVEAFRAKANIADRQFDSRLYKHVAGESQVYRAQTYEGGLETEKQNAALNWQQPGQIELSVLRSNQLVTKQAINSGLRPENEEDAAIIETQQRIAESSIHAAVIDQMLLRGQDVAAKAYYTSIVNDDRMTPETAVTVGAKLQSVGKANSVLRGVDLVWEEMGPQGPNDPVRTDLMGQRLRELYSNQPDLVDSAIKEMNARAKQHNDAQAELTASNKAGVLAKFKESGSLLQVQQTPEFLALDGTEQTELLEYMRDLQTGRQTRENYPLYTKLSDPATLRHMTVDGIQALEPELGSELTQRLLDKRSKYDDPVDYQEATIDDDMFRALAAEVFRGEIDPYRSTDRQSSENLERLGRFRSEIEKRIEVEDAKKRRDTGKSLSLTEKEEIARKVADRRIMETLGFDTDIPAVSATAEERRENALMVPLQRIQQENPQWLGLAINIMRSEGVVPLEWTDEKAMSHFKGRLEKAYAHSITGGDTARGMEILTGSTERRQTVRDIRGR